MKGSSAIEIVRRVLAENPKNAVVDLTLTPAGVLCLLYPKDGECCVLLNKRSNSVEHHKGEICFPGGRRDARDKTLLDTALREAYEEMGIIPGDVDILGEMGDFPTISNFLMSAYVGTIPYPYRFVPNEEVAAVLEVPLSALMDAANLRHDSRLVNGEMVDLPSYAYQGHLIFGATARVLEHFLKLVASSPELSQGLAATGATGPSPVLAGSGRILK